MTRKTVAQSGWILAKSDFRDSAARVRVERDRLRETHGAIEQVQEYARIAEETRARTDAKINDQETKLAQMRETLTWTAATLRSTCQSAKEPRLESTAGQPLGGLLSKKL